MPDEFDKESAMNDNDKEKIKKRKRHSKKKTAAEPTSCAVSKEPVGGVRVTDSTPTELFAEEPAEALPESESASAMRQCLIARMATENPGADVDTLARDYEDKIAAAMKLLQNQDLTAKDIENSTDPDSFMYASSAGLIRPAPDLDPNDLDGDGLDDTTGDPIPTDSGVPEVFNCHPIVGGAGLTFEDSINDMNSCTQKGYQMSRGRDRTNGPHGFFRHYIMKDGVKHLAYCLNIHMQGPYGSYRSDNPAYTLDNSAPETACAVAWLLCCGYREDTDLAAWFAGLGVSGLDELDAYYMTQMAIWITLKQLSTDLVMTDCSWGEAGGRPEDDDTIDYPPVAQSDAMVTGAKKLVSMAANYSRTHSCSSSSGNIPHGINDKYTDVNPDEDNKVGNLSTMVPSPSAGDAVSRRSNNQAIVSNCPGAEFTICAQDTTSIKWKQFPNEIRTVCGRVVIGPFQFDANAENMTDDPPTFNAEAVCGCTDGFGYTFTDNCGRPGKPPKSGETFYIMIRITDKFLCFKLCVQILLEECVVYFCLPVAPVQSLGTMADNKIRKVPEVSCLCICVIIPEADELPEVPPPLPFAPPPEEDEYTMPTVPAVILPPPVVIQQQAPQPRRPPEPARPAVPFMPSMPIRRPPSPPMNIIVPPPPRMPPPPIINQPHVLVPPPPPPPTPHNHVSVVTPPPPPPPPPRRNMVAPPPPPRRPRGRRVIQMPPLPTLPPRVETPIVVHMPPSPPVKVPNAPPTIICAAPPPPRPAHLPKDRAIGRRMRNAPVPPIPPGAAYGMRGFANRAGEGVSARYRGPEKVPISFPVPPPPPPPRPSRG
jgi:hypothetical protein